jgi:hypothetical protein
VIDFIPEMLNLQGLDRLVQASDKAQHWLALARILAREWFTHCRVVREMSLARHADVYCGSRIFSWINMVAAAAGWSVWYSLE